MILRDWGKKRHQSVLDSADTSSRRCARPAGVFYLIDSCYLVLNQDLRRRGARPVELLQRIFIEIIRISSNFSIIISM